MINQYNDIVLPYLFSAALFRNMSLFGLNNIPNWPSHFVSHIGNIGVFKYAPTCKCVNKYIITLVHTT